MKEIIVLLQDSVQESSSEQPIHANIAPVADSAAVSLSGNLSVATGNFITSDSVNKPAKTLIHKSIGPAYQTSDSLSIQATEGKTIQVYQPAREGFTIFRNTEDKIEFKPRLLWKEESSLIPFTGKIEMKLHRYQNSQLNWTLLIGILGISLLILLKIFYQKFINQVFNTLFNFQLAEKMLREKNILARRAFLIMNINFVIVFALFILLLSGIFSIRLTENYFFDYLIILAIIISLLLVRLIILTIAGRLFNSMQTVVEHVHISYLVNKNLGIVFLPIVFSAIYVTEIVSNILLITCLVIFILANIYKLIRSFQIFIRNGVLLYYAILYLCTLELLPLAISTKILFAMR
jgi:hypothetical protein